jgi:acyl-CoA synthetase (AMP-forming)/AMP-acid ligase II/thioesterase domain-containing protein/acyl carrier protein
MLHLIADRVADDPDAFALLAPGRAPLTYARLYAEICENARLLRAIGISKEDRVALLLPNGPEAVLSFLATSAISVCAPLNPACTVNELDAALSLLKPKALIASPDLDVEKRALAAKHGIRMVTAAPALNCEAGIFTLSVSATARRVSDVLPQPGDLALILHTSGTTSRPKLVGLTHEHLCRSAENIARALQLSSEDRCLNIMPLFHIHGIVAGILASLHAGTSVVCSPGFHRRHFFRWLQEFQPSWYTAVPTMHAAIVARAAQQDDVLKRHSLRFIRSCSAPLPGSVLRDLEQWFGVPVLEAYGMTEAAHQIACNPLPPGIRKLGSVGVSTGTEIATFDELGQPLGPDCEGEIVIRGGNVISCYLGNAAANQQSFTGGWFRTGDVGSIDRDGYVFIKGRAKEFINRGGVKISPYEIEEVLLEHPNVAEAVVFAMPESRVGEEVAAAIVLREPRLAAADDIREFASRQLSYFKIPRQIVFLDKLPKGPTGKPQRVGLAARLGLPREEHRENVPMCETHSPLEDVFATMWAHIIGKERVGLDDNFFEIGGDSLAAMELIAAIEQVTGQKLTIAALFQAPTIKQLAALVERYDPGGESYVVPLQGKGSKPPFFCVDAGPRYLSLAQRLGPDRPILGLIHSNAIATSIEAMAEFSVKSIRAVQPDGPYFVGGWCTGGLIAYEIAQQLLGQGQDVALLVLFDAVNPGRLDGLSIMRALFVQADEFCRKIWFHLRSMTRLEFGDLPAYFLERLKNVWHTLTRRTWAARAGMKMLHPVLRRQPPSMYLMGRRYRPKPYTGQVLLFRRSLRPISRYLDWQLGWAGVINGQIDVVEIRGGHSDMFDKPGVQLTAAALAAYLQGHPQGRTSSRIGPCENSFHATDSSRISTSSPAWND